MNKCVHHGAKKFHYKCLSGGHEIDDDLNSITTALDFANSVSPDLFSTYALDLLGLAEWLEGLVDLIIDHEKADFPSSNDFLMFNRIGCVMSEKKHLFKLARTDLPPSCIWMIFNL